MASSLGDDEDGINDINVTPLVDVMLVLLIVFMVTANYMTSQSIDMKLPKAATGQSTESGSLALSLDKDGKLFMDGKAIEAADLPAVLAERKAAKPDVAALISADVRTPHGEVVKLIDVVRKNGITNFAINVEVEEP